MGIARRATKLGVLAAAAVSGCTAAFVMMMVTNEPTARELPARYTVADIEVDAGSVTIVLEGGRRVRVDTAGHAWNALHLALLYPGKTVTLVGGAAAEANGRCTMLVPLLQADRPALAEAEYARLRTAGLGDRDLAVSFRLPHAPTALAAVGAPAQRVPGVCIAPT